MKTKKSGTLAAAIIALALTSSLTSTAFAAQRYLVVFKSNQSFQTAAKALTSKTPVGGTSFAGVNARVENGLANLNTLVVRGEEGDVAKFRNSPDVAIIEKEIFHLLPQGRRGLHRAQPPRAYSFMPSRRMAFKEGNVIKLPAPWGIGAVKAPPAWPSSNRGGGARVAILDTGLDVNHPLVKPNFEKGKDFTNSAKPNDITDLIGHGTHVSGTVAGVLMQSGWSGVAPQAKLLMGRVCSEEGCSNVAVAQGIEWAIQEKVDVISMSLGGSMSTPAEKAAVAAADQAGITVVAAAGNDGTANVGFPAALPTVIAVGAIDSTSKRADFSQYGPELAVVAPGVDVVSTVPMGTGRESVVSVAMNGKAERVPSVTFGGAKENDQPTELEIVNGGFGSADDFAKANGAGKYVLVSRGGSTSIPDKIKNAIQAKVAGILIYNNAPGLVRGSLTQDGSTVPMVVHMVLQETGNAMLDQMKKGAKISVAMSTSHTDYDSYDGTSMATPHVAGVVALIKAANKNLKPADVKAILQQTATKLGPNDKNEYGAGLVNAEAAVKAALAKK